MVDCHVGWARECSVFVTSPEALGDCEFGAWVRDAPYGPRLNPFRVAAWGESDRLGGTGERSRLYSVRTSESSA